MNITSLRTAVDSVKHWYIPLIIGIVLVLVGIYVFATPVGAYETLSLIFSASFLVVGILQIIFSVVNRMEMDSWGWHLVGGILYTLVGLMLLARPEISMTTLPFIVGFYVLFHSINELGWALDLKNMGFLDWGNMALIAVLGIIFSFILIWNPFFAGLSLVIWTGLAFVFAGLAAIMFSFKLRKVKNLPDKISAELRSRIEQVKKEYMDSVARRGHT